MAKSSNRVASVLLALALSGAGCASTYYSVWEKLGYEKRDILVSRVETARDDQTKAKEQFQTTLEQFKSITGFNGGALEDEYKKLSSSYDKCQSRAKAVSDQITSVDKVANAMFAEWTTELDEYHDQGMRAASQQKLNDSKARYAQLLTALRSSESKMQPVLDKYHDVVLSLKHDLDAAAISSLQGTVTGVGNDVQNLIQDMDASINEANAFIDNMKKT